MPTLLCVPIMVEGVESALADAAAARDAGADMVEFRIDQIFAGSKGKAGEEETNRVVRLVSTSPLPCIVTCRPKGQEGGFYDGDDMLRISLFERLGAPAAWEHPPRYIDVEYSAYARSANLKQKVNLAVAHDASVRELATGLILSMHDFEGRPPDLLRRLASMQAEPAASVLKIAFRARSLRDNLELFDILTDNGAAGGKPMIALAMGQFGLMSRVLAPKFGGFLTFASLRPQSATAPGQPTVRELLDLYRFRSIRARTRVYGVVGWPVEHSLSPVVHNAGFEAIGHDGAYLPLPIPPEYEHFKATLGALIDHERLDFRGCSVTIPHKENLVRFAREESSRRAPAWEIDDVSHACGAANTLVVERGAGGEPTHWRVLNTDAPGAASTFVDSLGTLAGRRIWLIGAGGVARAIACGLQRAGAAVTVCNRTQEKAERMAHELNARAGALRAIAAAELSDIDESEPDAIVNCTPVGMAGGPAPRDPPLPPESIKRLGADAVVMDTVYTPLETPLLRAARAAGLRTVSGLGMFVRQAAMQFEAWTGGEAPVGLFERVAREELLSRESGP